MIIKLLKSVSHPNKVTTTITLGYLTLTTQSLELFTALQSMSLSRNKLSSVRCVIMVDTAVNIIFLQWSSVDALNDLPSLKELRLLDNPFLKGMCVDVPCLI